VSKKRKINKGVRRARKEKKIKGSEEQEDQNDEAQQMPTQLTPAWIKSC